MDRRQQFDLIGVPRGYPEVDALFNALEQVFKIATDHNTKIQILLKNAYEKGVSDGKELYKAEVLEIIYARANGGTTLQIPDCNNG